MWLVDIDQAGADWRCGEFANRVRNLLRDVMNVMHPLAAEVVADPYAGRYTFFAGKDQVQFRRTYARSADRGIRVHRSIL